MLHQMISDSAMERRCLRVKWSDYYERYDSWQPSTQYSRLASVSDFGSKGSPSDEIADCIQYVDARTAASIVRRALDAGVRFRAAEIADIADSGQVEDADLLGKLIWAYSDEYTGEQLNTLLSCFIDSTPVYELIDQICSKTTHFTEEDILALLPCMPDQGSVNKLAASTDACFSENGLNELCDYGVDEEWIKKIAGRSGIPYGDDMEPIEQNVVVSSERRVDFAQQEKTHTASATAGKYDNYDNRARIKACEKKLAKLKRERRPNQFEIDQAQKRLDEAKLFQSCQIFKSSFGESFQDPNDNIMFSDGNEVLWFGGVIIRYRDLKSYSLIENVETETRSKVDKSKLITAAVMGEVVFDDSLLGIALANPEVKTTTYQRKNGFQLCVKLKNGMEYSILVPNAGFFKNKASKRWYQVCERLDEVIERYK